MSTKAPDARAVTAVQQAARMAARRNRPVTDCPFDPGSDSLATRVLARRWVSAYLDARGDAAGVDYSGD